MTRTRPTKDERHAAALLQVKACSCASLIPYDDAKLMSANQIISLFHDDHYPIPVANGGTNHPSNLVPRLIASHREKTAKIDVPQIAKGKRLRDNLAAFHARIAAKTGATDSVQHPKSRWPQGRKIQNRGFTRTR